MPHRAYKLLAARFGPQGWWPVTPPGGAAPVYFKQRRRLTDRERFEICAGAILTQNMAWTNAERALTALNEAGVLEPLAISSLARERLERLICSSGYYRQKAEKLRGFSVYLLEKHPEGLGKWLSGPLADTREELLSLHGIGPETADSILLYAGRRKVFVVDAYAFRLAFRTGWLKNRDYSATQAFFQSALPASERIYNEYHALIVELAKKYCTKNNPDCPACPLKRTCARQGAGK